MLYEPIRQAVLDWSLPADPRVGRIPEDQRFHLPAQQQVGDGGLPAQARCLLERSVCSSQREETGGSARRERATR
jgi:hypothetical protein